MHEIDLQPVEPDGVPASDVDLEVVTGLRPGVGSAFLDQEAVLLDPETGASHLLDGPATLVTRLLDGQSTLREIAFDISDVLGVDPDAVDDDVVGLVRTLGAHGLLEGIARDPRAGRPAPVRAEGVPVGSDLSGWGGWREVGRGARATLLVNWGTGCGFCSGIAEDLAALSPRLEASGVTVVLVATGDEEQLRTQVGDLPLTAVFVEERPEFFAGLGTPVAYLVGADGTVLEPLAIGAESVPALAHAALG